MSTSNISIGATVAWKWRSSIAEGTVSAIYPHRFEIESKGKVIVRNGSHANPALLISHPSGNPVLKLLSEVQITGIPYEK